MGRACGLLARLSFPEPKARRPPDGDTPAKEPRASRRAGPKDPLGTRQSVSHIGWNTHSGIVRLKTQ